MSLNVTFNGAVYIVPETGEVGWGGNVTSYLIALAAGALQKTGGSFTLSAETDFGASFGLMSLYYKSRNSNVATSGIVRLNNNSDSISWRNAANSANLPLTVDASNRLSYNGVPVLTGTGPSDYVSSLTGTVNQVTASASTGAITLSLPQSIATGSSVQFGTLALGSTLTASAIMSLASTTLGFLPPRMTTVQRDAITTPATGLMIYNTTTNQYNSYDGSMWVALAMSGGGTVNAGLQYQLGYYATNGTTVSGLSSLVTDAGNNLALTGTLTINNATASALAVMGSTNGINPRIIARNTNTTLGQTRVGLVGANGDNGSIDVSLLAGKDASDIDVSMISATNYLQFGLSGVEQGRITSTGAFSLLKTTDQIILGTTNTTTLSAAAPSASRTLTIPDPGMNASFVMTEGSQTINGSKSITALTATLAANMAAASFKLTGLGAGTTTGDSVRYEQVLLVNGGNAFTANQPMGGFKLTGLGAGTTNGDSVRYEDVVRIADTQTVTGTKTFSAPLTVTDATADAISAQASVNGINPRITARNTNSTSGQARSGLIGASGDNGTVELSLIAGKDSSNNNVEILSGTTKVDIGVGGVSYASVKSTGVSILGTTTNDAAATGYVGESVSSIVSSGSAVALTTSQYNDVTSITLSAGDWDVSVNEAFTGGAITGTIIYGGFTTTSGNSGTGLSVGDVAAQSPTVPTANSDSSLSIPPKRVSISSSTTYYLKAFASFTVGTISAYGRISARRVR